MSRLAPREPKSAADAQRRERQLAIVNEELEAVERRLVYLEKHRPIGKDGLYANISDRDKALVLLAMLGKLSELRDAIQFNGALS